MEFEPPGSDSEEEEEEEGEGSEDEGIQVKISCVNIFTVCGKNVREILVFVGRFCGKQSVHTPK